MKILLFGVSGETGTILATCGGNTVCFIDVMTGLVMKRFKDTDRAEVGWLVGWLLNVPATCECISGTDLLRQLYVLPH